MRFRKLASFALLLAWMTIFLALAHGDWRVMFAAILLLFAIVKISQP